MQNAQKIVIICLSFIAGIFLRAAIECTDLHDYYDAVGAWVGASIVLAGVLIACLDIFWKE